MIVECIHCGKGMCNNCDEIFWSDDGPFCREQHALIFAENQRLNAQEANNEAEREVQNARASN
jgi:hypothetical protein